MPADIPPPDHWIDVLASKWSLLGAMVLHLVRTEVSRAVLRRDVSVLKDNQRDDRATAAERRREDQERIDKRLDAIAADVRSILDHLIERRRG